MVKMKLEVVGLRGAEQEIEQLKVLEGQSSYALKP